ncbi:MAG: penicillin-binding protein 2 [Clostridia bacterium]|nr:penicillin-binding protein 2 [Clostridia bacterium]
MQKRIAVLVLLFGLLFLGVTGKAFYEQILMGPSYASQSLNIRTEQFPAEQYLRGDILDRNGLSLTDSAYRPTVVIFPRFISDARKVIERFHRELPQVNIKIEDLQPYIKNSVLIFPDPFILKNGQDPKIISVISRWDEPGIAVLPYKMRYGRGTVAVHLIGYMGFKEKGIYPQGMTGIEKKFDEILKGQRAEKIITPIIDARSNILKGLGYRLLDLGKDASRNDIYLTLDLRIQRIVEEVMDEKGIIKGGVIILDIQTGNILAAASRPLFDPNDPGETMGFHDNQVERTLDYKVYPGSVFKVITAAAALEEGIITPESKFVCTGSSPDFRVQCPRPHGELTFSEAMEQSCNVTFVQVGLKLGREKLKEYISEKFGIEPIPGKALDSQEAIAHGIIGQVIFQVSPLEMANIMATIARDGYHQELLDPWETRLLRSEVQLPRYKKVYSLATAQKLKAILKATNQRGSGKRAWVEQYGSAGKTGTPQANGLGEFMAWYTGYAPLEQPRYAVSVLIEELAGVSKRDLQGGTHAGPVFKEIMEKVLLLE